MGWYTEQVLPHLIDRVCSSPGMDPAREAAGALLTGEVVEIGFGSGANVGHYSADVTGVHAVEPSSRAWELATDRVRNSAVPITHTSLVGEEIGLPAASMDSALCTFTLCTVNDPDEVLAELARVLRPGASLVLVEHGLAPSKTMATAQRLLDPVEVRVAGGCHLTRDPVQILNDAGWDVDVLRQGYAMARSPWSWLTTAVATPPVN